MTSVLALFLSATPLVQAACEAPVGVGALAQTLGAAEIAFVNQDKEGVLQQAKVAEEQVPCLSAPIDTALAGSYHRVQGLRYFLERDVTASQVSFQAARSADPTYKLPETIAPEGHPVAQNYTALETALGQYQALPQPASGTILLNGVETLSRPISWSVIYQRLDDSGKLIETSILSPETPSPVYDVFIPPDPVLPPAQTGLDRKQVRMVFISGGAAATSLVLLGTGWLTAEGHRRAATVDAADNAYAFNQVLVVGGFGMAGVAVATGFKAGITVEW